LPPFLIRARIRLWQSAVYTLAGVSHHLLFPVGTLVFFARSDLYVLRLTVVPVLRTISLDNFAFPLPLGLVTLRSTPLIAFKMLFPTPQHFFQQGPGSVTSDDSDHQPGPFQWDKFDDLFDRVFANAKSPSTSKGSGSGQADVEKPRLSGAMPGAYGVGRLLRTGSSGGESGSEDSGENFGQAWEEALKRTRKTVTTTTKRRIIRHTPEKLAMPVPSPATAPRLRYPKTPYPNVEDSEDSSDGDYEDSTPFSNTLLVPPNEGLTPELHSPVKYVPDWKRESSRRDPVENRWLTATFDMPIGLSKNDIHVAFSNSFGAEKITVSWQYTEFVELVEAGKLVRERRERKYHRTLPLPKGTTFKNVQANLTEGLLTITYPTNSQAVHHQPRPVEVLQLTR